MKILLIFLMLAFVGLYVIMGTIRRIARMFMGEPPQQQKAQQRPKSKGGVNTASAKAKKKVISKDEGEYIDYEEIKDK